MRALFAKEWAELRAQSLVAGILGGIGLCVVGRYVLDYGPPERGLAGGAPLWALIALTTGAAMGYWQWLQERMRGTDVYLCHRASGPGGAHRAKVVVGLLGLGVILALGLGLHAAWFAAFSEAAPLARWERVFDHLALATLLVSGHGLGLLASVLPRKESTRFAVLLLGAGTLYLVAATTSLRWDREPEAPLLRFALTQLALGALFALFAGRIVRAAGEPERPLRGGAALALAPLAVLLLAAPFAILPTRLQRGLHERLLEHKEHLVRLPDGRIAAAAPTGDPGSSFALLGTDAAAEPEVLEGYGDSPFDPDARVWSVYDPDQTPLAWATPTPPPIERRFTGRPFELDGPFVWMRDVGQGDRAAWYEPARGRVLAIESGHDGPKALARLGKGPSGARFSPDTVVVFAHAREGPREAVLVDRADGSAWRLADGDTGPTLVPAPLPEGDELVDVERVYGLWRVRAGLLEPYGVSDVLLARGRNARWAWSGSAWKRYEPEPGDVLASEADAAVVVRVQREGDDVLWPSIAVTDARTGEVRLVHTWSARGARDRWLAGAIQAVAVLRPPLASAAAFLAPASRWEGPSGPLDRWYLDPALLGGRRPWLVALGLLLAALLAASAARYVGRAPADQARRRLWVALVLAIGWPALFALALIEPRRARPRLEPEATFADPRPLVASRA